LAGAAQALVSPCAGDEWEAIAVAPGVRAGSTRGLHAFLTVILALLAKNLHFSSLFCDFSLRSPCSLAIVPNGPSFSAAKQGFFRSRPAPIVSGWKENTGG